METRLSLYAMILGVEDNKHALADMQFIITTPGCEVVGCFNDKNERTFTFVFRLDGETYSFRRTTGERAILEARRAVEKQLDQIKTRVA